MVPVGGEEGVTPEVRAWAAGPAAEVEEEARRVAPPSPPEASVFHFPAGTEHHKDSFAFAFGHFDSSSFFMPQEIEVGLGRPDSAPTAVELHKKEHPSLDLTVWGPSHQKERHPVIGTAGSPATPVQGAASEALTDRVLAAAVPMPRHLRVPAPPGPMALFEHQLHSLNDTQGQAMLSTLSDVEGRSVDGSQGGDSSSRGLTEQELDAEFRRAADRGLGRWIVGGLQGHPATSGAFIAGDGPGPEPTGSSSRGTPISMAGGIAGGCGNGGDDSGGAVGADGGPAGGPAEGLTAAAEDFFARHHHEAAFYPERMERAGTPAGGRVSPRPGSAEAAASAASLGLGRPPSWASEEGERVPKWIRGEGAAAREVAVPLPKRGRGRPPGRGRGRRGGRR
jgi:hypothetical protein